MSNDIERSGEVVEHLAELRARLIRSFIYLTIGTVAAWYCYEMLLAALTRPMMGVMHRTGAMFLLTSFPEPFMVRLQICVVTGLILTAPLILGEVWGFISPGLTREESRPLRWIGPMGALLFVAGVSVCYLILPKAFEWFASYVPDNSVLRPSLQGSVLFTVKMMLAFGVMFELPVVLMLLGNVGIVNSRMLRDNWRGAIVGTSVVSAVITPSNDAFSMLMMAVPVSGLYFLSIFLVRAVEAKPSTSTLSLISRISRLVRRRNS